MNFIIPARDRHGLGFETKEIGKFQNETRNPDVKIYDQEPNPENRPVVDSRSLLVATRGPSFSSENSFSCENKVETSRES